ncbi:MAG: restriction endonuclease subunit S, partial [Planctomycetes bacterium]|nr:restriction endonuclease subunit S [Planctomycetota bacterium]
TDRQRLIPEHLAALATTGSYWRWVRLMSMRSGQPGINGREYGQLPLGVPPLPEQRAIAAALGDVDALLAALDAQIAKQRDLKQATMQQLLTGQTRLPGFTGEWQRRKLRDIACLNRINVIPANSPTDTFVHFSLPAFDGGKEPVVELGALIESNKFGVPQNAVLLSKLNPRIPRVWAPTEIPSNAVASTEFLILTPNGETSRAFLYVLCGSPAFCEEMELSATGTTGSHQRISPGTALDIEVMTPPSREEQDAIAAVLSDMDEVVSILQSRRAKTAALKQSMMQALLTGRIRLVEDVSRGAAENAEVNA